MTAAGNHYEDAVRKELDMSLIFDVDTVRAYVRAYMEKNKK